MTSGAEASEFEAGERKVIAHVRGLLKFHDQEQATINAAIIA